jgi:hypothetical protein
MTDTKTILENRIHFARKNILIYEGEINEKRREISSINGYISGLSKTIELMKRDD